MPGDTDRIRSLARALRERAAELRVEALDLGRRVADVPWSGVAAAAMQRAVQADVSGLRACADAHETAAAALDRHAREVEWVAGHLTALEGRVRGLVGSTADDLGRLAGRATQLLPWS